MGKGKVMAHSRCAGRGLQVTNELQPWGRENWPHSLHLLEETATQHMHRVEVRYYGEKRNQRYSYSFDMNMDSGGNRELAWNRSTMGALKSINLFYSC